MILLNSCTITIVYQKSKVKVLFGQQFSERGIIFYLRRVDAIMSMKMSCYSFQLVVRPFLAMSMLPRRCLAAAPENVGKVVRVLPIVAPT